MTPLSPGRDAVQPGGPLIAHTERLWQRVASRVASLRGTPLIEAEG